MFSSKNDSFFTQTNRSDDSTLNVNYVMDDGMIRIPVRPNEKAFELEDDRRTKKEKKSKSKGGTVLTRMSDWRD